MVVTAPPHFLRLSRARRTLVIPRPDLHDWSGGAGVLREVDGRYRYVRESGLWRDGRAQIPPPVIPDERPAISLDAAVFAGYLYDHYGHFLLESLARLWAPAPDPPVPLVWIAAWTESFEPWMTDVLDLIGAPADRVIVTAGSGPVDVDHLLVPDAGFEFNRFMHPWLADRLACHPAHSDATAPGTGRRCTGRHVWLSRSALVPISGLDEELELDARLEREGWDVVHPEQLTIAQQLDALAGAVHIGGIEGSALHTLVLLRDFRGVVDLFTRQHHHNFELVAAAAGLDQHRHRLPGATPRERRKEHGVDVQWSGVDLDATVDLLRETCRRHGHPPPG